jgi:hypothetical protein
MSSGSVQLANLGRYRGTGRDQFSSQAAADDSAFDSIGEDDEEAGDTTPFLISSPVATARSTLTSKTITGPLYIDIGFDRYASPAGKDSGRGNNSDGAPESLNPYASISATPSKHATSIPNEASVLNPYYGRIESQSFDHEESSAWRDHQRLTNK